MKKRRILSITAAVVSCMIFISAAAFAEGTNENIGYETFCTELADVLREKHVDGGSAQNTDEYLKNVGVFDNIADLNTNGEMRYIDAKAMLINALSDDKDKIMQLGNYPTGYAIAYKALFGETEDERNLPSNSLLTRAKADEILRLAKRYVCDKTWLAAYNAVKDSGMFVPTEYSAENMSRTLTRAEAAMTIAAVKADEISKLSDYAPDFVDVTAGTAASGAIGALQKLGIFNGYEDGTFRPDNNISILEFYKACICAADLEQYGRGEYPDRYTALVTYFDLCGGMGNKTGFFEKLDTPITYGQAIQIVYNIWLDKENVMLGDLSKTAAEYKILYMTKTAGL